MLFPADHHNSPARKAGVLVLVFINEGTEGPGHFKDEREAPEILGEGGNRVQVVDVATPYLQVPLFLRQPAEPQGRRLLSLAPHGVLGLYTVPVTAVNSRLHCLLN